MLVTRKHAASIHPAAKRKRLRCEHPFRTHCRCIGRTDGSATGRGKSGSSGATSTGAGRGAKSFMCVSVIASPALEWEALAADRRRREQSTCQASSEDLTPLLRGSEGKKLPLLSKCPGR